METPMRRTSGKIGVTASTAALCSGASQRLCGRERYCGRAPWLQRVRSGSVGIVMDFAWWRIGVLLTAVTAAFACETVVGFGATLFALAIAGFVLPVPEILPVVVPVNVVLSAYLTIRYARFVRWRYLLGTVVPPLAVGIPIGYSIYALRSSATLQAAFGLFVTALACFELWGPGSSVDASRDRCDPRSLPAALRAGVLLLAGIVHGLFASGGPLVVYAAARDRLGKEAFRATLSALWLGVNLVMVVGYRLSGKMGSGVPLLWVVLAPALVAGIVAGERLHRRVDRRRFERAVFWLLALAGTGLFFLGVGGLPS